MNTDRALVMAGGRAFRSRVQKASKVEAVADPKRDEAVKNYKENGKTMTKAELVEVIENLIK